MQKEADQEKTSDQDIWSGKMSLEPLAQTKEKTSVRSSKKRSASSAKKPPLFLCLSADVQQPDALMEWGGDWSVAWRVFDAQFWGVPQRRRRIALVADFGGLTAPEILFEREGLSGDTSESGTEGQGITTSSEKSSIGNDKVLANTGGGAVTLKIRSGCEGGGKGALMQYEKSATLSTHPDQTLFQPVDAESKSTKGVMACMATQQGGAEIRTDDKAPTLTAAAGMSGNNQPVICIQGNCIDRADTAGCNGKGWTEDVSYTLNTIDRPAVVQTAGFKYLQGAKAKGIAYENEKAPTLSANQPDASVVVALENHPNDSRVKISEDNVVQTLSSRMGTGGGTRQ